MTFDVKDEKNPNKIEKVDVNVTLYKVSDQDKVCIDIQRSGGNVYSFYRQFDFIKDYLDDFANTTY